MKTQVKTLLFTLLLSLSTALASPDFDKASRNIRETLTEAVAANTSNPPGNEAKIASIVAKRLKAQDISYEIVEFELGRENIVARLKSKNPKKKPLLLISHTDVVGTQDQKWTTAPHTLTERDGFLYGRGVSDDLGRGVMQLEAFLLLKEHKIDLNRDVILAMTGDEEAGGKGVRYLLEHRPDLIDAETALNEGGGPRLDDQGKVRYIDLQTAEKSYQDFTFTAEGTTGHSSVPQPENAIYRLSRALDKLGKTERPARLLPVVRAYFEKRAALEPSERANAFLALSKSTGKLPKKALQIVEKDSYLRVLLRTTCVATMLNGGTAENALPPLARANVNCRILPDESIESIQKWLETIVADPKIRIQATQDFGISEGSPTTGEIPSAIQKIASEMSHGVPIVPFLSPGATDSRFLRMKGIQAYGFGPIAITDADRRRAHGIDERIPTTSLRPGIEFLYRMLIELLTEK